MVHMPIRKFNTRDTYPEQKLDNDLCQAVIAGWQVPRRDRGKARDGVAVGVQSANC
jgi:hypothetical protein